MRFIAAACLVALSTAAQDLPAPPSLPAVTNCVVVRFSEEEWRALKDEAIRNNTTAQEYVRAFNRIMAKQIVDRHRSEIDLMQVNELGKLWSESDYVKRKAALTVLRGDLIGASIRSTNSVAASTGTGR